MTSVRMALIEEAFNRDVYNSAATHPLQAWEWGEARKAMGIRVFRFGEFDRDSLRQVFQMTVHPVALGYAIGYLPRSTFPSPAAMDYLRNFAKKERLIFIKIEPYVPYDKTVSREGLSASPHPLFPDWTQLLDLTPPEETLLKNMKPKTRYNIRLAEKKGVTVREETNETGYRIFEKLYFETCKRQKYYGHTPGYHRIVFDALKNGIAHILVAYLGDTPLSSYELFHFGDTFYYPYGGSSDAHRNVMAANLLMWEAIRLGKRLGAKKFDMWGSLPPEYDMSNDWAGFTRFKEGYGTAFVRMAGSFDLIGNPLLYALYNAAYVIRKHYLSLRKLF